MSKQNRNRYRAQTGGNQKKGDLGRMGKMGEGD